VAENNPANVTRPEREAAIMTGSSFPIATDQPQRPSVERPNNRLKI
jgi:hypothetical protein